MGRGEFGRDWTIGRDTLKFAPNVRLQQEAYVAPTEDGTLRSRITVDPAILVGKPVVRGTRIAVEFLIGLMADGWSQADILDNYPGLEREDLAACLAYARDLLASERVYPSAAE